MIISHVIVALVLTGIWIPNTHALGVDLLAGQWEFEVSTDASMAGVPRSYTHQVCLQNTVMTPADLMRRLQPNCQLSSIEVSDAAVIWQMACEAPSGTMVGHGLIQSSHESVAADLDLTMSYKGQETPLRINWLGRYLGACPVYGDNLNTSLGENGLSVVATAE